MREKLRYFQLTKARKAFQKLVADCTLIIKYTNL